MNKSKGRDLSTLIKKKEESTKANDASIQGEITSVIFRNGPIEERQTKDIGAAFPFFLLLIFSGYLLVIAIKDGDLKKLFSGYNKNGEPCGFYDPNLKFIYFPDTNNLKSGVCLSECPKKETTQLNCEGLSDCLNLKIYDSIPYLDIVCLPTDLDARKNIKEDFKLTIYEFIELNLKSNILIYLVALLASLFLGILFAVTMLYFPKFLSYFFIFITISIILIFASFFMILYASPELILKEVSGVAAQNLIFMTDEVKLTISIILFVVAFLSCLLIYLNRIEIKIGINMFKVTAFFLKQVWFCMFLPLIFTILFLGYIAFSFYVVLNLISIEPYDPNLSSPFGKISPSVLAYVKLAIFLFQSLWVLSFIAHSFYFLLNSGVIYWYFSDDKVVDAKEKEKTKDEPSVWATCCQCFKKEANPLPAEDKPIETVGKSPLKGMKDKQVEESAEVPIENSTSCFCIASKSISKPSNLFLKKGLDLFFPTHMFSVIISSLLIIIFGVFNSTFGYIYNKLAHIRDNTVNGCLESFLKAALCCCYCYDKVFRFISQDGYFSMVIQGTDYFTSSKDVFFLRVRGDEYNTKGNGAGNLVIFLAKSFIILTTLLGIFSFMMDYGYEMEDIFRTTIISFFIALVGAWLYTTMFYILSNALLLCYLMDKEIEINHYGRDKPHSAPDCLADFMLNVYINWYQDHEE